ncbi:protein containing DUF1566 [Candidatus Thiomargarita nelsonii]|uniref:Protein containing DUF1566 n=1 Tax=Candidatus Thiomargarita nelsonii TaxID=1003181 RepID=A0A0A6RK24_9GAMM|nr:protein containing DUF1566 [Candidatus Thiomargarita nelsonii]
MPDECLEEAIFKLQAQIKTQAQAQQEIIAQLASQQKALNEQIVALKKMIEAQQEALKKAVANLQQKMSALETTKQDKQIQSLSPRYIDKGDGTVTDNRTGLFWLKKANCFGRQNWETAMLRAAKLAHGQCGLNDRSKAGDWRLPSKNEWKAMVDDRFRKPAFSNATGTGQWKEGDALTGVQSSWYWSSSASSTSSAWSVTLYDGSVYSSDKTFTNYVWPVRGGH